MRTANTIVVGWMLLLRQEEVIICAGVFNACQDELIPLGGGGESCESTFWMHLRNSSSDVRMYIVTFSGKPTVIYGCDRQCWMSSPNDSAL